MLRIGVDTGGTFTDLVLVDEDAAERRTVKVPSTPRRPADAVFAVLERAGADPAAAGFFVLGTTIATNALLERKGCRTLYVTTAGFEDALFIQRVDRKSLYDLQWVKPRPYVARPDCFGVRERVAADGSVRVPLEVGEVDRVVGEVGRVAAEAGGEVAVAVNLLFAYANPEHERRLAEALRAALPGVPVSVSSEVAPIWREYERGSTVVVDAYLKPLVGAFADELDDGLEERGFRCPRFFLKSNGGQVPTGAASRQPSHLVLSGLAGGLIGGKHYADAVDAPDVVTLDMGGTSADVGVVVGGAVRSAAQVEFEWGLPIAVPVVDLTTVGAGGSSLARIDRGGFLQVGPESAGADPGPAAYGKGAEEATVTDANLVLGRLNANYFLGGELRLDPGRARAAVARSAERLGGSVEDTAQAIVDVAVENMAGAVRLLCAARGLDYTRFDLMAFGGAGPLHGAQLARRVGLRRVVVPPSPGLTSAFGALAADLRVDRRLTRLLRSDLAADGELAASVRRLVAETLEELAGEGAGGEPLVLVTVSARYLGQNYEQDVPVPVDAGDGLVELVVERFHEQHRRAYGYRLDGTVVELVHLNATAIERRAPPPSPPLAPGRAPEPVALRPVYLGAAGWAETPIYRRPSLGAGATLAGPAVIEEVDSTTLVLYGQVVRTHESGCLILEEANVAADLAALAREAARA
jgi:N-methylhydantoinase A